jgi:hypothetical protein
MKYCKMCGCELTKENKKGRLLRCIPCHNKHQKQYNHEYNKKRQQMVANGEIKPFRPLQLDKFILNAY